jgi:LmbE family N-acetylglucosaminyl deacetylase
MSSNILCILAHQDDEYVLSSRIRHETADHSNIKVMYLTDGSCNVDSGKRNRECIKALHELKVDTNDIIFLGNENSIKDTKLCYHLSDIYPKILEFSKNNNINKIFTLSYEGGNPDHDSCYLISLALAKELKIIENTFQFPIYNSNSMPYKLFRVMTCVNDRAVIVRKLNFYEAFKSAFLFRYYKSQWKSWIGLAPEAIFKYLILRRELFQTVDLDITRYRPHDGPLYYEKRKWITFENFMSATSQFRNKYLY